MQDGQFQFINPTPEYKPIYFDQQYFPARAVSGGTPAFNDDLSLYEDARIAHQSGFTNWINTFIQGVNDTQIGIGASDLMDGLVKKANIERKISQLDADHSLGSLNDADYLNRKNNLLTSLQDAYSAIQSAQNSIYEDEQDKASRPISKGYQLNTQLTMLQGGRAGLSDQFKYSLPNIMGSSAATLGATLLSGFGAKVARNIVTRAAAGSTVPGIGTAAGILSGLGTLVAVNAYARNLESKAEVGSQFLADYEALRQEYLSTKLPGYELSDEEDNRLILQAAEGSNEQYWKNMTLALSDSLQSLIFAGVVGKAFSGLTNVNKFTRLAGIGAQFYVNKKLEGLEEGLQYAFQTDKSLATRGFKDPASFGSAIFRNYADVIGSMDFLGVKGKGAFSGDKEFQANVNAGELLGGVFGGASVMFNVIKDLNSYRQTTKELANLNPTKVDSPFLKFKDELYANFFGPKDRGALGLFSEDAEDRVFFFKEGLKTLNKKRLEDGSKLLTDEELTKELSDIDLAFSTFQDINKNLDSIMSPFGKEANNLTRSYKQNFRNELFHNTLNIKRLDADRVLKEGKMVQALDSLGLNDVSQVKARLDVVTERLDNAFGIQETFLKGEKRILEDQLKSLNKTYESLEEKKPKIQPIDQNAYKAINDYYDVAETRFDYGQKHNELGKVKAWKDLIKWGSKYEKTAGETAVKKFEDARLEDNAEFAESQDPNRPNISLLNDEDKVKRTKSNKEVLERAGFTKSYIDTLSQDALDKEAAKALEDFKNKVPAVTEDTILGTIIAAESKDELLTYLSRPAIRAAFNRLGFNINDPLERIQRQAENKAETLLEDRRVNKIRRNRPQGLESNKSGLSISRIKFKNDTRDTEDYISDFKIQKTEEGYKASQKDILESIIVSAFSTDSEKELARKYLSMTQAEDSINFKENWRPVEAGCPRPH